MDKKDRDLFEKAFKEAKQRAVVKKQIISEISSEKLLQTILIFLKKNQSRAEIKISQDELENKLKNTLNSLLSDLKEYQLLITSSNCSPTQLRKTLESMKGSILKLEKNWDEQKMVNGMLELILAENPNEIKTTVETFREASLKLLSVLEPLSLAVSEDLIWEYRLEEIHPDKRGLFYLAYESNNRFLFLVSAHLYLLAEEIGITSSRGKVQFIHRILPSIDSQVSRYFKKLGHLNVTANTVQEMFRSRSWVSLTKK